MLTNRKNVTVDVKWNSEERYERRQWNNWVYRMLVETQVVDLFGGRSWFITLTYNDDSLVNRKFVSTFNPDPNATHTLEKICRKDLARWLDLCRKKFKFRYICTVEYGKKHSRIHHHLLLHTHSDITYRSLPLWPYGFSKAKLVTDPLPASTYIAKYLVKQNRRIKCSSQYGLTIIRYLKSKQRLELLLMNSPKRFQKLMRRYSGITRTPTPSLIMRTSSSISHLSEPYKYILVDPNQLTLNLPTTQSPDLCTIN